MMRSKVLVVEDEKNIARIIAYNLEREGYKVEIASDGEEALEKARREAPDLIILDLMLPKSDGLEVCRMMRSDPKTSSAAILMLTAKTQETDRVVGLEMGADDYMAKPFSNRELIARVKAILRRTTRIEAGPIWRWRTVEADWERRTVKVKGKQVPLTPKEFELLKSLAQAHGRVLSRDLLLQEVWGYEQALEIQSRTVDLHISQLRQKLGSEGKRVLTVTGAGYRFQMPDEE